MKNKKITTLLLHEEKRALKSYLLLFYITLFLYDFFYYYLYPKFIIKTEPGFGSSLSYWNYILFLLLIPVSYLLIKKNKLHTIKYLYLVVYMTCVAITDIILFTGETVEYRSGNAAELILILFSPIFISKGFYWTATITSILRYLIVGIFIQSATVVTPIAIICILSIIAYIFLKRSTSYIDALTSMYEELRNKEKLAFIGQIAASIGHEIKNPLASLKGFTQLQKEKDLEEEQQYYLIMEQEIDRINSIVNDLLLLGKPRSAKQFRKNNINEIIAYVISITQQLASQKEIELLFHVDDNMPTVLCDENQLKQVFINLIKNGIDAMNDGGVIRISSKMDEINTLSISIIDQGCGIRPSEMERLFDPFYTTKVDGTGLGLLVSKKIVEDHKGQIQVESEVNNGTMVEVILPIVQ
ncbi:ATP-binding protein [Bacillus sp. S/N-304-OC-R1]|uniref:ATP-binding protein n=1 Tax=Bacillus sp. S/N-304-OC-R1 TaxID=2758034 RepID=UPI001C8D220F|nr:ATP-binding protein [Bacillus sp. S/N-304-OC-R1]MBY0121831.1 two-component sensor histidine kinase [Bacillus sp. S/N-304-OC-R1]